MLASTLTCFKCFLVDDKYQTQRSCNDFLHQVLGQFNHFQTQLT